MQLQLVNRCLVGQVIAVSTVVELHVVEELRGMLWAAWFHPCAADRLHADRRSAISRGESIEATVFWNGIDSETSERIRGIASDGRQS